MTEQYSIWKDRAILPSYEQLTGSKNTDVLIIGGGLCGILCAYKLKNTGIDCTVLDSQNICGGVTGNTTAKITSQHGLLYHKLLKNFGAEKARFYFEANQAAVDSYRQLCKNIDCDYEEKDSYIYSSQEAKLKEEKEALDKLGINAEFERELPVDVAAFGAIRFKNQAQFSPLKFISEIVKELEIYEHTPILEFDGNKYKSDLGSITANKVIVATHFPIFNKHGAYFLKLYQHRSYVIALENALDVRGMYADEADKGMSFRNYGDFLLVGGGDHRTGKKGGNWAELETYAAKHWPDSRIKYRWAAQDCVSLDGIPYIGQYAPRLPNAYVASGFNKWGISSSMLAADLLTDLITGKENKYTELFDPSRSILHPQLFINAFETTTNLLTPTKPRCPHLGCALKWNKAEHSWDCPCHGSRFADTGKLQDGPATGNLKQ